MLQLVRTKKGVLVILIVLLSTSSVLGQAIQHGVPDFYINRIKSIDQFMERFNRDDMPGYLDSTDADFQYKQVLSCFCFDSLRGQEQEMLEFARYIVENDIQLGYEIPNYYCELLCDATIRKSKTSIILRMVVDTTSKGYHTWAIADAEGDVLRLRPTQISSELHLSPVDNSLWFPGLRDALERHPRDVMNYGYHTRSVDQYSVFMTMIAKGLLKIENIRDMSYKFDVGRYRFTVRCINRETNNNGWLICEFVKK